MDKTKIVIIGLDGMSFDLVKKWLHKDTLPNFYRLSQEGIWGRLDSVIPYQSITSWTSFMTGKNPAKHGHFNFLTFKPGTREVMYLNNFTTIKGPTIWDFLNEADKKIGVMNVPCTYPVKEINGFMIPCWLTPPNEKNPTYPPSLAKELRKRFGDYLFEYRVAKFEHGLESFQKLLRGLYFTTEKRAESAIYLMKKYDYDLFMVVFTAVDSIQHFFWHFTDETHPLYDPKKVEREGDIILKFYQKMDKIVGDFLAEVDPDNSYFFAISDHGFGPLVKQVNINKILNQKGLLTLRKEYIFERSKVISVLEKLDVFNLRKRISRNIRQKLFNWINNPPLDWSKTKAYCGGSCELGVYINLKRRSPYGIVDEKEYEELRDIIAKDLLNLHDPENGQRVIEQVIKKEDIYKGEYLFEMPDLLLVMAKGYEPVECYDLRDLFIFPVPLKRTGWHRLEGVVFARGKGIKKGGNIHSSIMDLAPTILYLLAVLIDKEMVRRIMDIFEENFISSHPPEYVSNPNYIEKRIKRYKEREERVIMDRLKSLGYL